MLAILNGIHSEIYEDEAVAVVLRRVKTNVLTRLGVKFIRKARKRLKVTDEIGEKTLITLEPCFGSEDSSDFFEEIVPKKKKEVKQKVVLNTEIEKIQFAAEFSKKLLKERAKTQMKREFQKIKRLQAEEHEKAEKL